MASRNENKALKAIQIIKASNLSAEVEFLHLELSDWVQTKAAAQKFVDSGEKLDILINNAAIFTSKFELNEFGVESDFAVNHLGHFVFTKTLIPALERSEKARVVVIASKSYIDAPREGIQFDKMNDAKFDVGMTKRYGQSKLANILFAKSLAEQFKDKPIWVNIVHPGFIATDLSFNVVESFGGGSIWFGKIISYLANLLAFTPEQAMETPFYVATSPDIETRNYRGEYFVPVKTLKKLTGLANDLILRDKLWDFSEKTIEKVLINTHH
ncbi:hypothetical protein HK096_010224 [Nowakowskiella sp. JEL0078]|nr:hypothetical protein HK096_010224 [Nowakowskiella sp. JEL0078]